MKKLIFVIMLIVLILAVSLPVLAEEVEATDTTEPPTETTPSLDTDKIISDVKDVVKDDSDKTVETLKVEIKALWEKVRVGVIGFISLYGATIIAIAVKAISVKMKEIQETSKYRESEAEMKKYYNESLKDLETKMNKKLDAMMESLNLKVENTEKERQEKIDAKSIELADTIKQIQSTL